MKVCIAEKPSVAKEIASIIGANAKRDGYFEGNGYCVTWTFGHLCTLKEPHEYAPEWKSWHINSLPMIPPKFGIKLIDDKGVEKQFATIEKLIQSADTVINCGDAGQEGELIQRWVMQKAGCKCKVERLWISSLTEESIKEGFNSLKPQEEFDKLYEAGLTRAIGDWLLGINATRLYTVKYGQNRQVLSVGRVQTPTLALIVNRQLEIENFIPTPYWELKTVYRDTVFSAAKGKYDTKEKGEEEMSNDRKYHLIVVTVNQGYTDQVMQTARKAGATGGTVIRARLTNPEMEQFGDVDVQEEKEIVTILASSSISGRIMEDVNREWGLRSEAKGMVCALPVDSAFKV